MSATSKIEWTDRTWNPLTGCTEVSRGCDHCYAKMMHERFHGSGSFDTVNLHPERLDQPLRWRKPSMVFVNSMSDLFHRDVPDSFIVAVFDTMANARRHTFQLLTKRHARMRSFVTKYVEGGFGDSSVLGGVGVLPNVWLGVSVENQQWADIRIPALCHTPAAVRFLSCEPLLGPIDLALTVDAPIFYRESGTFGVKTMRRPINWVIVGGESGRSARPMQPEWARSLRDQCVTAGIAFLFKQWGEHAPRYRGEKIGEVMQRVGKHAAGRELDGRTWDEYPERAA